ncbi:MAG: alpha/beta hydrolase [Candidatus Moranbacteria bacterium]|nr:alpha/beta hydrolase [Candidatus Moranbacteria bacterium]
MNKKNIIIDGLNVRYYLTDNFDPEKAVVFLHGWGSEAMHFGGMLQKIESAAALDLPGFGGSEKPKGDWFLEDYVEFVRKFIEQLGIKKPVIAGHSFGGSIAIRYASEHKDAVDRMILIGSAGIRRKSARKIIFLMLSKTVGLIFRIPGLGKLRNAARKRFYKAIDSEDYIQSGELSEIYKRIVSEDISKSFPNVTVPTLLIWGEDDKETPISDAREMSRSIPGSELEIIKGAGHYVFLDKPEEFERIFFSFIRKS